MSRFFSYINSSKKILDGYDGSQPFPFHIKKQFAANKQFGSKDRKMISEICYAWLRTGHLFNRNLQDKNLVQALFLCVNAPHPLLAAMAPELEEKAGLASEEKLSFLQLPASNLFPFEKELGAIDNTSFILSFLKQPLLFLRLRPGKEKAVMDKLEKNSISFSLLQDNCIAMPNATKLEEIIQLNKEAVIQDKSSQSVFHHTGLSSFTGKINVWDCCAASGGKSILLFDRLKGNIKLTVSDIRENILHNCKRRLQEAGINIYQALVADVANNIPASIDKDFSIIICDAPCSGSGTWARTPEQLAFFKKEKIGEFAALQKSIATNASRHLKEDGLFFYITCSVFKQENEGVVEALQKGTSLQLLHSEYLPGYNEQADTMFIAVFRK